MSELIFSTELICRNCEHLRFDNINNDTHYNTNRICFCSYPTSNGYNLRGFSKALKTDPYYPFSVPNNCPFLLEQILLNEERIK